VIANDELGDDWTTYPERLQAAGVSWQVYQDAGDRLDQAGFWGWTSDPFIGNYVDNSLLYFLNYQNAAPSSPLYLDARTGTDVKHGGGFFRHTRRRCGSGPAAERFVDRRAGGVHRASGLAGRLRRLVHGGSSQRSDQQPGRVVEDGAGDHVRRERWLFDHLVAPYPNVGDHGNSRLMSSLASSPRRNGIWRGLR
jgi:Phosphoesterase family